MNPRKFGVSSARGGAASLESEKRLDSELILEGRSELHKLLCHVKTAKGENSRNTINTNIIRGFGGANIDDTSMTDQCKIDAGKSDTKMDSK